LNPTPCTPLPAPVLKRFEQKADHMTQISFNLPAVWAPYLVNGDRDSLRFEAGNTLEIDLLDEWRLQEELGTCLSCSEIPSFTWKPDGPIHLGAECLVFTFELHAATP
jgi:hypothetical protein